MRSAISNRKMILSAVIIGALAVLWLGLRIGPMAKYGLGWLLENGDDIFRHPFAIELHSETAGLCFLLMALYGAAACTLIMSIGKYRRGEEYGSAQWASPGSVNRKFRNFKEPENNILLTANVGIGSDTPSIYRHGKNTNVMVIGGAGSGKTRGYVIPNLLQASSSYVILDPSGEILRATGSFLQSQGYAVRVLDLCNLDQSDNYNPFMYIRNDDDVQRMVDNYWKATEEKGALKGEQVWDDAAKNLMFAYCFYLYHEAPPREQNISMVLYLAQHTMSPLKEVERLFAELSQKDPEHIALKYYRAAMSGADRTRQSVVFTLLSRLGKFNLKSVSDMSSTTEDDLALFSLPETKTAIFAVTPVADLSYNFFVSLLYTQLFQIVYDYGNAHGYLKVPLHFLMDEFANVTLPDDFEQRLATFRKYHVSASIILQDISQLQALFEKEWKGIVGNADTMLYLGGNEDSTHELISKKLGKQTIKANTFGHTRGRNGSYSKNEQQLGRELMTPDEVRELDTHYALLFIGGARPVCDLKYDLMSHPNIGKTTYGGGKEYDPSSRHNESFILEPVYGLTPEQIAGLPELNLKTGKLKYPLLIDG